MLFPKPGEGAVSQSTRWTSLDRRWMSEALIQARAAQDCGEVPVGAIVVDERGLLAAGFNEPIGRCDPTAHAEIIAIRRAAKRVGNYRLTEATLYVTLEPCPMCAAAIIHARFKRVVYAASDERWGAAGSALDLLCVKRFNHRVVVDGGLYTETAAALLKTFFRQRRKSARSIP